MLCYVLGRLHSSCVLSTKVGLHRIELINKIKILKWYRIGFFFPFLPFQILIRKYVIGRLIEKLLGLIFSSQSTDLIVSTTK